MSNRASLFLVVPVSQLTIAASRPIFSFKQRYGPLRSRRSQTFSRRGPKDGQQRMFRLRNRSV
jgi:hypothetical protein